MDFRDNITKNAFSYKYSSADDFVVTFEVFNSIESVFYTLPITVTPGVYGLSLDVVPKFAKIGEEFSVSAFLMQGGPTTKYRWIFNSATIITNRSCNYFLFQLSKLQDRRSKPQLLIYIIESFLIKNFYS